MDKKDMSSLNIAGSGTCPSQLQHIIMALKIYCLYAYCILAFIPPWTKAQPACGQRTLYLPPFFISDFFLFRQFSSVK